MKDVEVELKALGFEVKKSVKKTIHVYPLEGMTRASCMFFIQKRIGGHYKPDAIGSSAGRVEVNNKFIYVKPRTGGSGAGAEITRISECAQCLYADSTYNKVDLSVSINNINIDATGKEIETLDDSWIDSCVVVSNTLYDNFKGDFEFHRGSSWVKTLENHFKALNRVEKEFSNINKWSPADIYMLTEKGSKVDVTTTTTISELNSLLITLLESRDVIGISLKKVVSEANFEIKNSYNYTPTTFTYTSVTPGKVDFMRSGDSYLSFSSGEMQFRKFGSNWQGEIKGKHSAMGKIGGGQLHRISARYGDALVPEKLVRNKNEELIKNLYEYYIYFYGETDYNSFLKELEGKDSNWWLSKYMSVEYIYKIDNNPYKNDVVTSIISYAASESELSAPYVKVY